MIFWQTGGEVLDLGQISEGECPVCEKSRPIHLCLAYRYFGLYWAFKMVTKKQYMALCSVCGRGSELDTEEIEDAIKRDGGSIPIPFMHRYGLLCFVGGIVLLILLGNL